MKTNSVLILLLSLFSITAFSKIGTKPPQPMACEESARTIAFEIGADDAQGNDPVIGDVKLKTTIKSAHGMNDVLVFDIEVENNNEDGEVWVRHTEVQLTKSIMAGACVKNSAKVVKTESIKSKE